MHQAWKKLLGLEVEIPGKISAWGRLGGAQWPILYTGANHTLVVYTVTKTHPSLFLTYKLELGWFLVTVYTTKV